MRFSYKKIQIWAFYIFIFLLPWQTIFLLREPFVASEKWQYGTIGIYFSDLFLFSYLILTLIVIIRKIAPKKNYCFLSFFAPCFLSSSFYIFFLALYLILSGFLIAPDKFLAFYFSLKLLLGIGLFFAIPKTSFNWQKMIFILLLGASLQSALGIWQFTQQITTANKLLGISEHSAWQGGTSVIENETGRWLRAYGGLPHPNVLGGYLAIILLLVIFATAISAKQGTANLSYRFRAQKKLSFSGPQNNTNECFLSPFLLPAFIVLFISIILSFSRSAWLVTTTGLLSLLFITKQNKYLFHYFFKLLVLFFASFVLLILLYSSLFFVRTTATTRLEHMSLNERQVQLKEVKAIINNNFLFGVGAGNYTKTLSLLNHNQKPIWKYQPVHNVFLLAWAELGIVGLLLVLITIIIPFFKLNKNYNFKLLFYFFLSTFCFLLLFDHWLWTSHFGLIFFWLTLGLFLSLSKKPISKTP